MFATGLYMKWNAVQHMLHKCETFIMHLDKGSLERWLWRMWRFGVTYCLQLQDRCLNQAKTSKEHAVSKVLDTCLAFSLILKIEEICFLECLWTSIELYGVTTQVIVAIFFNWYSGGGVQLGPLRTATTNRPIVPAPGDYDDGEIGGMMISKGNRSTRRKPAPVPLCPPQTPHACPDENPGHSSGKPATIRLSYSTAWQSP
jgi:hypothetical protein